ncbi:hypothetical protein KY284_029302 [Solanum tuberosum]|nr:hypothetical protein KY284_029302 [Solanum tuberosum]
MMYYITLVETDVGKKKIYEAKIWVKEWEDFKKVVEFKQVSDDNAKSGGIMSVPFPNNPEFQDLAQKVVTGMMYYITLAAINVGKKKIYEAKIWLKEWEDFKKVVEFKLVGDNSAKLGGIINVSFPNNPEFQDLARFAVQDYNKTQYAHLKFVENLNVKEQLVSGMMYYITLVATDAGKKKIYEAKIWVKEWEDFKKVVEFKLVGDDSAKPGGIINIPFPNSPKFQDIARFVVQAYNKKEKAQLEFVEVLNVKEQVVVGMMYYITLAATDDVGKKKIYEAKIWVKEWEDFKKVIEFKLLIGDDVPIPGSIINVQGINNLVFQDLARFAIQDHNKKEITLATTDAGKKKIYEAKIWVKKWEDFKKVVEFKLVGDDSAKPGGIIIVPFPNSSEFLDLARFVVQDYNKKENAHLEFVENLNVKEQVVAGIMYYITLAATDDAGKKKIYETKIWVKEWEDFKKVVEFKLVGEDIAKLGGITDVPFPNNPEFQDLARFAIQGYNKKENVHLEFVENLNVKQQVVAGMMYYITLAAIDVGKKKIYETKIWVKEWEDFKKVVEFKLVGDDSTKTGGIINVPNPNSHEFQDLARFAVEDYNNTQNAHLEFVENLNVKEQLVSGMMYYITLAATDAGNKKEYEAKIWVKEWEDFKKVIDFKLVGNDSAKILGGFTEVPFPNNPEFRDLTRFAIHQYNKNQNAHLEFVENLNVKKQVVAGMLYYITFAATDGGKKKIYEAKIWVKEWENFKKVVEFKLVGDDSATMPGGIINVPFPNIREYQDLARFAVQDYNKKEKAHLEFVENLNVKEQVVAGMMYYITLVATDDAGKKKIYEAKIWVKEWENFKKVIEFKLFIGDDVPILGGIINVQAINSLVFQDLARFAVQDHNKKEKAHLEFVEVLNVKEQVVAGMMYYITLAATDAGKKKIYEAKIWVKEWEDFKKVVEFKLVDDDSAKPGGIIIVPFPISSKFQDLAHFAVQDYNKKENAHLEFVEVLNVKEQVVAGMMYYITLVATDDGYKKIYQTKIWVKEWENFKEVQEFKQIVYATK